MAEGDIKDPKDYGSIVRNNLMKRPGYAPYCAGVKKAPCGEGYVSTPCDLRFNRMVWDGEQFACHCGSRTEFPADFIEAYKARWHQPAA